MITRIQDDQYLNIFELIWLFCAAELIVSMSYIKVYNIEDDEWNLRRLFWYAVCAGLGVVLMTSCVCNIIEVFK